MNDLLALLDDDASMEVPPESSDTVRTAAALGPEATASLRSHLQDGGYRALLALEAIRAADPAGYADLPGAERARIYADALAAGDVFNAWGLPGFRLSPTAEAFAAIGPDAIPALAALLDDDRPAPMEGSQDATTARRFANRVADYALVLLGRILGEPADYPQEPAERDRRIAALRERLA